MINVSIYGLDQYIVGDVSTEITPLLAKLYECSEDDINFIANSNMVFHKGVEQTSWRTIVEVKAPEECERVQKQAFELFVSVLGERTIHTEVTFFYYCRHDHFVKTNEDYPLYLTEENTVNIETEYDENMVEGEGDDEIYTGDIFQETSCCDDDECDCHEHHHKH